MSFRLLRADHLLGLPLQSVTDVPDELAEGSQQLLSYKSVWLVQGRPRGKARQGQPKLTFEQELQPGSILI